MTALVPNNIWFASVLVSFRKKESSVISIVSMAFGLRAETRPRAYTQAEAICNRCVEEITAGHPDATILAIRALVGDHSGEAGIMDCKPAEMRLIKESV